MTYLLITLFLLSLLLTVRPVKARCYSVPPAKFPPPPPPGYKHMKEGERKNE
jgi:hypothetical protein